MNDVKKAAVQLKLEKAKSYYAEVEVLIEHQFYSTAINRLYYSCFHATQALLLSKDLITKTHNGVVAMLHTHFVLKSLFDPNKAAFLSELMRQRSDADYGDFIIHEKETVQQFIVGAKEYIDMLSNL